MIFVMMLNAVCVFGIPREQTDCSWYGRPFHGRLTTCGETYNMHELSVASPTLPMGTIVRFWYEDRTLDLIVNDGGPFATNEEGYAKKPLRPHPTRGFDFSMAAYVLLFQDLLMGVARDVEYAVIGREIRPTMRYNLGGCNDICN